MSNRHLSVIRSLLAGLSLALLCGGALAQQRVMVTGDSISAGQDRPSYRKPLLDALSDYNCPVQMVGDQTMNSRDYRNPTAYPGSHFPGFSPADGYDTDHQAFPAITTDKLSDGTTSGASVVQPIAAYVLDEQPNYVLVHLGTNDLTQGLNAGISTDAQINSWANQTRDEMNGFISRVIGASQSPDDIRVLVANFIPYDLFIDTPARTLIAAKASAVYTSKLEALVAGLAQPQVLLVDVATGFNNDTMTTDGIHPNAAGEEHFVGAFLPILRGAGLCLAATPKVVSPAVGSIVLGSSTNFSWTDNGTNATSWRIRAGNSQSGSSSTWYDSGNLPASTRSVNMTGLPANGANVFVSIQYNSASGLDLILSSFISKPQSGSGQNPALTSPTPSSVLPGSSATFNWVTNGASVDQWWVYVGSSSGGKQYFDSGRITDAGRRSAAVTGLPTNGSQVHVQLNWKSPAGDWSFQRYTYTAASGSTTGGTTGGTTTGGTTTGGTTTGGTTGGTTTLPAITTPASGSVLTGSSVTLNWATNGTSVDQWWVYVGSAAGGTQYLDSGRITNASSRSLAVTGLPTNGSTVHVQLNWKTPAGAWANQRLTYTAASGSTTGGTTTGGTTTGGTTTGGTTTGGTTTGGTTGGTTTLPAITTPASGSVLTGSSVTLNWATNGTSVDQWWVYVGSAAGGTQYLDSGRITNASSRSLAVTGLPTNGSTVHVQLNWKTPAGAWANQRLTYTAASGSTTGGTTTGGTTTGGTTTGGTTTGGTTTGGTTGGSSTLPAITTPVPGSVLTGSSATLNWVTNGTSADQWWVYVGSSAGGNQYFDSGRITNASSRSLAVTGLPTNGSTVHVQLNWKKPGGAWLNERFTYVAKASGGT